MRRDRPRHNARIHHTETLDAIHAALAVHDFAHAGGTPGVEPGPGHGVDPPVELRVRGGGADARHARRRRLALDVVLQRCRLHRLQRETHAGADDGAVVLGRKVARVDDGVVCGLVRGESDGAAGCGREAEYAGGDVGAVHGGHLDRRGRRDGVHDGDLVVGARARLERRPVGAGGLLEVLVWCRGRCQPVHRVAGGVLGLVEGGGTKGVALVGVL